MISPVDAFFITLAQLKFYEKWDKQALTLGYKRTVVEKTIMNTLETIREPSCDILLVFLSKKQQFEKNISFRYFKEAIMCFDVVFQP